MEARHGQKIVLRTFPLPAVFHLAYSKYKGVKIGFYTLSKSKFFNRFVLVLFM